MILDVRRWRPLRAPFAGIALAIFSTVPASAQVSPPPVLLAQAEMSGAEPHQITLWSFERRVWISGSGSESEGAWLTVETALRLLADNEARAIWPHLLKHAGPNLEGLRDAHIAATQKAMLNPDVDPNPRGTLQAVVEPQVRATLQHADALADAGRLDEAIALLRARRGQPPPRDDLTRGMTYVSYTLRLARLLRDRERRRDPTAAIATLREAYGTVDEFYAINLDINRAAILAESGRYTEALELITQTEARFLAITPDQRGDTRATVPASRRFFSWIRACALHGLGREAESLRAFSLVLATPEPARSSWVLTANTLVRTRARACMRDVEGLVDEFIGQIDSGLPNQPVFTWLQPSARLPGIDPAIVAGVRAHPRLIAALGNRLRNLPANFAPALNQWRSEPSR